MGNQSSQGGDAIKKNINHIGSRKLTNGLIEIEERIDYYPKDNYSSYKGLRTETTEEKKITSKKSQESTSVVTANQLDTNTKVSTMFEWKEGGNIVFLTGSFSNWTQWFVMNKNLVNNNFEISLELPKGVHQYKFIVDNIWKFSKHHSTCNDGKGNINNIIDTTNYLNNENNIIKELKANLKSPINKCSQAGSSPPAVEEYSEYLPKKNELNTDAPVVPQHYATPFSIDNNTKQNNIVKNDFIKARCKNDFTENNSFKSISIPPHINLYNLF